MPFIKLLFWLLCLGIGQGSIIIIDAQGENMKILLTALTALVLTACTPEVAEELTMNTVEAATDAMTEAVELSRAYAPYLYIEEWDECSIEGEIYENVSFGYSTIGLYYVVDGVATYVPDLPYKIDYCTGEALEWQPDIIE